MKHKPKPLGTELKNGVDSDSGVMICAEIQEGNWAEGSSLANAPGKSATTAKRIGASRNTRCGYRE